MSESRCQNVANTDLLANCYEMRKSVKSKDGISEAFVNANDDYLGLATAF